MVPNDYGLPNFSERLAQEIKKRHLRQSAKGGKTTLRRHGTAYYKKISAKAVKARRRVAK